MQHSYFENRFLELLCKNVDWFSCSKISIDTFSLAKEEKATRFRIISDRKRQKCNWHLIFETFELIPVDLYLLFCLKKLLWPNFAKYKWLVCWHWKPDSLKLPKPAIVMIFLENCVPSKLLRVIANSCFCFIFYQSFQFVFDRNYNSSIVTLVNINLNLQSLKTIFFQSVQIFTFFRRFQNY